ncbi:MAG: GTP cyclohydrolase I FolE2 [Verrucomicrobiae bacterium]|nr:GTP cyclohydrolase I FolE2 [Verrucomicrobiae bacterium]
MSKAAVETLPRPSGRARGHPLTDKQNEPDHRRLRIDKVGVRGLRFPAQVRDKNADTLQNTVATVGLFVDLPHEFKGTHMSRFVEALNAHGTVIHVESIPVILQDLQTRLHARNAHLELEFPFFLVKRAPVSGKPGVLDYTVRFEAAMLGREYDFVLTVKCNVTTLCPCSKAISRFGAHNQRGEVTVQVRTTDTFWIEDLIALIESCGSSEMYSLLKREDEKAVTERAYENPVFVEDLVRSVCVKLNQRPGVTWYKVEAENYESIHNHNAYACIEKG